jgi:hypothetical protein
MARYHNPKITTNKNLSLVLDAANPKSYTGVTTSVTTQVTTTVEEPYADNVSLLLNGNGDNGSTTFTDSSSYGHTVTPVDNAQISTAQSKFGGASIYLDGSGDCLSLPDDESAFNFGTGDFTIECWIYWVGGAYGIVFSQRHAYDTNNTGMSWRIDDANDTIGFWHGNGLDGFGTPNNVISKNTWTHIALTRNGSTFTIWVNGQSEATNTITANMIYYPPVIGRSQGVLYEYLNAYLDDYRITKGVARYTSNFTPPTAELSLSTTVITTETQQAPVLTDISLNNNTATLYNGVGYTSSNLGYFTFDGTNDYMEIPYDESVNLTDGDFTIDFWMNSSSDQTSDVLVSYGNTSNVGGWAIKTATNKLQYSVGFATHPAVAGIVTSGLVLHLDAGNTASYPGSGNTWFDLTTNSNDGTINGATYDSANGGSLSFDGVNNGVSVPGTNLSLNQMTISSWNYSTNYNQNGFMFEKTTNGTVNTQYSLFYNATGNNAIYYRTFGLSSQDLFVDTTTAGVVNNQWNNIVATFDGSQKKIYVNGVLRATQNVTGTVTQNSTGLAYIGIYGNFGGYPFNGNIASTQIYNKALTASEIQRNYNALKGRYTSQPSSLDSLDLFNIVENADFSSGITTNTWNHYALVRSGNVYTPYVNAVPGNPSYVYGVDSNMDLYFDNASIILNANGDNGSTNIIDSSKNNHTGIITAYNGAGISTAEYKFGGSSLYFDGTDHYIDCGTDSSYAMEDEDFTIEFWMYTDQNQSSEGYVFRIGPLDADDGGLAVYVVNGSGGIDSIRFEERSGGSTFSSASITRGQWNHIAWTRSGSNFYFFVNGTNIRIRSIYSNPYNENDLILGAHFGINQAGGRYYDRFFNGYIDDFRITKGVAKYTEDFIPPDRTKIQNNEASLKFGASGTDNSNPFNGALSNLKIYKDSLTQSEITQNYNAHKSRYGL